MFEPDRNSSLEDWLTYDRTRPLFEDWEYKDIPYPIIYELYHSKDWRELENLIIPHHSDKFYYPKRNAMSFDELVEYIKTTPSITYSKFCVDMDYNGEGPVVCGTCIPKSITYENYHIIRELLPPPTSEPLFLQEADRPDLVPCIKHLYPNHDWFHDWETSDNWNITLIRYGIYPADDGKKRDWLPFTKKDIKKIKKGHRLCIGNMKPRNKWEFNKALYLSLVGYKNALPFEYFDLNNKYIRNKFMEHVHYKHVKEYLISKELYSKEEETISYSGGEFEGWLYDCYCNESCDEIEIKQQYVKTLKISNGLYDVQFIF